MSGKTPGHALHPLDLAAIAAFGAWIGQTDTTRVLLSWQERPSEERSDWRAVADAVRMAIEAQSLDQTAKPEPGRAAGCGCGHAQTGHAFSDDVCAVPECPCDGYRPQAVPELAALREQLGQVADAASVVLDAFTPGSDGYRARLSGVTLMRAYKAIGRPVPDYLKHLEGQ